MSALETPREDIIVHEVDQYSAWAARGIGELMPYLHPSFPNSPTPPDLLQEIAESPHHAQLIAVTHRQELCRTKEEAQIGRIVGATTLSVVLGAGFGRRGEMEDVIVHPDARGQGAGKILLRATDRWCEENNLPFLMFVTESHRPQAIALYEKWGAKRVTDGRANVEGILYRKNYSE